MKMFYQFSHYRLLVLIDKMHLTMTALSFLNIRFVGPTTYSPLSPIHSASRQLKSNLSTIPEKIVWVGNKSNY